MANCSRCGKKIGFLTAVLHEEKQLCLTCIVADEKAAKAEKREVKAATVETPMRAQTSHVPNSLPWGRLAILCLVFFICAAAGSYLYLKAKDAAPKATISATEQSSLDGKLLLAVAKGDIQEVQRLIKAGADVNAKANYGVTALMIATTIPNPDLITVLAKAGADVNAKSKDGFTALIMALENNPNPDVITALVKAGADVNAKGKTGITALALAIVKNPNPNVITTLVKAGADVNEKMQIDTDMHGVTALMIAAGYTSTPDVITALVKAGADVNAKMNDGRTALMVAAEENQASVITALVIAGADINAQDKDGCTALMLAAGRNPNLDVITTLLQLGADVNIKAKTGEKVYDIARYRSRQNPDDEVASSIEFALQLNPQTMEMLNRILEGEK